MERSVPRKLERIIGPLPGQREARAFSWMALVAGFIACGVSLYYGFKGETFMGRPMGSDFVQFYAAGRVLNQHQPARLYDIPDFSRLQHEIVPEMSPTQMLIFAYPQALVQLFRPFALLPYKWAYCAWLVFSLALYATGLWLLFRNRACDSYRQTAFLLSLSAPMYTLETWIGGQLSVLTFFAMVLFVCCFENRWLVLAGLALGLASFKPSLIAIPAAMMLVSGSWRMLAGLCTSGALMVATSIATAGVDGFGLWLGRMKVFSAIATSNESILRRTKYVDLNSFFTILLGGNSVARGIATVCTLAAFSILAWTWWKNRHRSQEVQRYLWAATITWTLMINIYVPVYDTILLVPAIALVSRSLAIRSEQKRATLQVWLIVLWLAPWFTQSWADYLRFQVLTVILAVFGYWTLTLLRTRSTAAISVPREDSILDAA